jgi:hypothetical protein
MFVLVVVGCVSAPVPSQVATDAPAPSQGNSVLPDPTQPLPSATPVDLVMADVLTQPTLARGYLTTPNELIRIARLAKNGVEPYRTAVKAELAFAAKANKKELPPAPQVIDIQGDQVEDPFYLHQGAKFVYAWALAYNLLRESDPTQAQQYALATYGLVMAMPKLGTQVSGYQQNTRLNIASHIQNWVYAADLLADWPIPGSGVPFANSEDAKLLKTWLGAVIIRYPYNAAHIRVNNWGGWGRLTIAVIADYVGDAAPLYVQKMMRDDSGAYVVDSSALCDAGAVATCVALDGGTIYAQALQLHLDVVDGKANEQSNSSCDANGSQSMIRPDGGIPDELRRQYDCNTTHIKDDYGAAARYSQFASESMTCLAELAWRRGDPSIYTHIDPATERGALYRAIRFLLDNNVRFEHGSMLEIANRFYSYQVQVGQDDAQTQELRELVQRNLPGVLKQQHDWPEDAGWVSFGTLTHGFDLKEPLRPPPQVEARTPAN